MVSVGELGTDVSNLEDSMKSILAVAEKWNAILLIDEVDIFLEQRDSNNIERNAMVGVFLRTLEYYAGILFLTTNRVKNLDQAFYSRVSLCLHYKDLDHETRKKIFENQLQLYCIQNLVNLDDIIRFCDSNDIRINGRQIKNTVRIAHAIATQQKRTVETKDFHRVLGKIKEFDRTIDK
jgi:SpoVK/Ycf46/Vps4 family AAA+-type ATPase